MSTKPDNCLSVTTINKYLDKMSYLFTWAKKNAYMTENHFSGLKIPKGKNKSSKRQAYSDEDLTLIFDDIIFSNNKMLRSYYFWAPLIAIYTGARIQEIGQLLVEDIHQVDNIFVFDFNENSPKKS